MELSTTPGADYTDLYSFLPFNSSFQEYPSELLSNRSLNGTARIPVNTLTNIIIAISITALYSVVCVVGLLGNLLVMYGIVRFTDTGMLLQCGDYLNVSTSTNVRINPVFKPDDILNTSHTSVPIPKHPNL
ncbi:Delta-type opioid receptor [Acipenser ruthenus]|uniref:Delta-type opioid receptor n=1 Tax=Acipenser ruthenus TaxID=7906 RepID=A0A662YN76_ACIRT|nr:Delta-type opioid receptor [Acipenser ruthenus]